MHECMRRRLMNLTPFLSDLKIFMSHFRLSRNGWRASSIVEYPTPRYGASSDEFDRCHNPGASRSADFNERYTKRDLRQKALRGDMGINMKVFATTDKEIRARATDPKRVTDRLGVPSETATAELWNQWRELDFVVGPQSSITMGDTVIEDGGCEGIHAIYSASVPAFAAALRALSNENLRERLNAESMRAAGLWLADYPGAVDEVFPEVLSAFHALRALVLRAEADGNGLIFCRYEAL
jgi:hypothetical protein